ncbi:MAG TPA: class I SAM-dependent methyltransferase [Longimicrobiaceae bacterium]|nr:class I SAM-dependent methyltransferase [Longimicrobiaceae bacterium]
MTKTPWYARWFGEEYLKVYPHRDQREARRAVQMVLAHTGAAEGGRVLDLACGTGRHLNELLACGLEAVGLDLSLPLLQRANPAGLSVVRGDMRDLPFSGGSFALVTSFFTSFGYFADPADDLRVLVEVRRVLRDDGAFALDFLNAARVRAELRPSDEHEIRGVRVVQFRSLVEGGRYVEKRIEIHDPADQLPRTFFERVRLYAPAELQRLLEERGLHTTHSFGDYEGAPLAPGSARVILIGRCA